MVKEQKSLLENIKVAENKHEMKNEDINCLPEIGRKRSANVKKY